MEHSLNYEELKKQALILELMEGLKFYPHKILEQIKAYEKNYPYTPLNRSIQKIDGRTYSINIEHKDGKRYINRIRLLR